MTRITYELSGLEASRVFGTGTALDTARLRYELGKYFNVDPRNVHAYVMGEHGDSEFVPWSQALLATKPIIEITQDYPEDFSREEMEKIAAEVKTAAYKIIDAKKATYYGIGIALTRITKAILGNENSVLTVSAKLDGKYGQTDVYAGVPCVINKYGINRVIELSLTDEELSQMKHSCDILRKNYEEI
jgi:L-lactate dehydrogenase